MIELLFKIVIPVSMIGVVTLVGRHWGPAVGGVLAGVPVKAGPILFFLALEQSPAFAADTAAASLGGAGGCGVFCLAYALVCRRTNWAVAGAAAYGAYLVVWAAMLPVSALGLTVAFPVAFAILVASRRLLPEVGPVKSRPGHALADLPARMIACAAMVVFVTAAAPHFGTMISGMLTSIPTIAAVLALFTHAQEGPDRAVGVMRGLTHGLFGYAGFLTVLAAALVALGVAVAFLLAGLTVVAVQLVELRAAVRSRAAFEGESLPVGIEAAE